MFDMNYTERHSEVVKIGWIEYEVETDSSMINSEIIETRIFIDSTLIERKSFNINKYSKSDNDSLISDIKTMLKKHTPRDKIMHFMQNGVAHSLGVTYKKSAGTIRLQTTYYYDYKEIYHSFFSYNPMDFNESMVELENRVLKTLESIRLNNIREPYQYYEIYNINGFGFEIGLRLDRLDNGDYDAVHFLDGVNIGNSIIKTSLIYGIEKIMDGIKRQLVPMCPADVDTVFNVGDNVKVKVEVEFVKEAGMTPVRIRASLDNMVYNVSVTSHFNYFDPDKMNKARKDMLDDIKGFLDTFPKSTKDICEVRKCNYLIGKDVSKKAGSNKFKMQMKLDNKNYGEPMEFIYNDIKDIDKIDKKMRNEFQKLANKLRSDTPNDIVSEYNKNEMDFIIHAHFTKKAGDEDIKIEYTIENKKK